MPAQLSADEERDLITNLPSNPDGFRQLYRHYFPRVYAYVASRVTTQQDAEDIVSDIFMKIIEAIDNFEYRGEGSFAGWLFRIAYNELQGHYRKHTRQKYIPIEDVPDIASESRTPESLLSNKELGHRLLEMLETLSPRRQEIISLRYFGELRNQEIAEILGLNEKSVASHLSRGLDDLKRKYGQKDVHEL